MSVVAGGLAELTRSTKSIQIAGVRVSKEDMKLSKYIYYVHERKMGHNKKIAKARNINSSATVPHEFNSVAYVAVR